MIGQRNATVHLVDLHGLPPESGLNELNIADLEKRYPGIENDLSRGDIIEDISAHGYRSAGIWFWNGLEIVSQDTSDDMYGMIPPEFRLGEFPPGYWDMLSTVRAWESDAKSEFYWHIDPPPIAFDASDYCPLAIGNTSLKVDILGTFYTITIDSISDFNAEQKTCGFVRIYWDGVCLVYGEY